MSGGPVDANNCAVLGDARYAAALMVHAQDLADEYHDRHHERTGEILRFDELVCVAAYWQRCGNVSK